MTIPAYGTVTEHGSWQRYQPSSLPEGAPVHAMYVRRDSDGADWYQYLNAGTNFQTDTVKMVVTDNVVSTATASPDLLFPQGALVLEVSDTSLADPHEDWKGKIYDPATQTFSDPPPPPSMTSDLERRIAALEAKLGGA